MITALKIVRIVFIPPKQKSYRTELPSLRFNASIDSVMNAVIQWEESLWFSSIQSSDQSSIHIVHRTPLMQFPDDVFITLTCTNGMQLRLVSKANQGLEPEILNKNPERFR